MFDDESIHHMLVTCLNHMPGPVSQVREYCCRDTSVCITWSCCWISLIHQ